MSNKPQECHICGCTEDHACMTDGIPCSWAFSTRAGDICSACVIELRPDPKREKYPKDNLLLQKVCTNCAHLVKDPFRGKDIYTCEQGRFDTYDWNPGRGHQWFVWSGVHRPNKTVAKARRSCQEWTTAARWQPSEEAHA